MRLLLGDVKTHDLNLKPLSETNLISYKNRGIDIFSFSFPISLP